MKELPLVTIAAVNYNNSRFVIETLDSIKDQTYKNIELIVVDDCSTDNSIDLIKEWLIGYENPYKLIAHEKNKGVCAACNSVLNVANGKYITMIATDDIMLPDKTKLQVMALENSTDKVGAIYSDAYLIKEDSSPRNGLFICRHQDFEDVPSGDIYDELMKVNFLPAMSFMIKMKCLDDIGHYDEELLYEDYDMWLRIARNYHFIYSGYVSVKYRIRKGSLMNTVKNWDKSLVKIYKKHLNDHPLAITHLENIALKAYLSNNEDVFQELRQITNKSNYLLKVLRLQKFKVPRFFGIRILNRTYRSKSFNINI